MSTHNDSACRGYGMAEEIVDSLDDLRERELRRIGNCLAYRAQCP